MEGGNGSENGSKNSSVRVRGCPSVSTTGSVRVFGSLRETGSEMEVVGVGWITHVKLLPEPEPGLVESCLHEQPVLLVLT